MGKFTNFQAAAAEIGISHATNMTILLSATNPGVQGDVDTILIKRINQLRQLDSDHGVPLLVGATTTDENGTLLTPFGEILQRNDLLMPSYQELLDLPTEELLAALPADNPAASQDNHHLLPKILMKVVNHLVSILPLQAIVTAFNLSPDYTKLNFCNVTLNASNIITTRHTLVDRINILRKAWCDTRTPPLRAPIPTVCAPSIRPIQSLNQVYTHQQMKVMISELVNDKDFPFIDLPSLLLELGIENVQLAPLSTVIMSDLLNNSKTLFFLVMDFMPSFSPSEAGWHNRNPSFSLKHTVFTTMPCLRMSHEFSNS